MKKRIIAILTLLLALSCFIPSFAEEDELDISIEVTYQQTYARETLALVNEFRTGEDAWYWNSDNETKTECTGLTELIYDYALEEGAMQRAAELAVLFDHTRPNGTICFSAYEDLGYALYSAGENIAYGYTTPQRVVNAWREDNDLYSGQGHRRNMLNGSRIYYACGCVQYRNRLYWVQIFSGTGYSDEETPANDSPSTETIPVWNNYIDDWRFTPSLFTLNEGESVPLSDLGTLSVSLVSSSAYYPVDLDIDWTSESEVISIKDGMITGLKEGEAILNGLSPDGSKEFTHALTVLPLPVEREPVEIIRLSGKTRYETSIKTADELKAVLGTDKFDTVILATGENFADALGGGYLAAKKNAPILLTKPNKKDDVNAYINANLKDKGTIYVLGGEGAVPEECLEGLRDYTIIRLSGKTRYETNLKILETAGVTSEDILIVTGENYADSLSASSTGKPMLLVNSKKNTLSEAQKSFLEANKENVFYILGGTGAVSQEIEDEITQIKAPERIRGISRQETSVEVANAFFEDADKVILAYSDAFPDGLCAGPLAHALNAPILLVKSGREASAMVYTAEKEISEGYVSGGTGRITDDSVRLVFYLTDEDKIVER